MREGSGRTPGCCGRGGRGNGERNGARGRGYDYPSQRNYGQDNCTELRTKTSLIIPEPTHTADIMARYAKQSKVTRDNQTDLQAAREEQFRDLEDEVRAGNKSAKMPLAHLKAEIKAAEYMMTLDITLVFVCVYTTLTPRRVKEI
jgi:hypothetical protein